MVIKKNSIKEYVLSAGNIDAISDSVGDYLQSKKIERKEILKLRISIENALIKLQERFGEEAEVSLEMQKRFGRENIVFRLVGERFNPLEDENDESSDWINSLRSSIENTPVFDYLGNKNILTFFAKKPQASKLLMIFTHLILGLAIGVLGTILIPEAMRDSFCTNYLTPIYEAFLNMFNFCGMPLIFLSVLTGILGVGDENSFNLIGRKMVKRFFVISACGSVLAILIGLLVFPQTFNGSPTDFKLSDFTDMIAGWIPKNLFDPLINPNAMQLVLIGIAFGVALLMIDGGRGTAAKFFNDLNLILLKIMAWLTNLIPLFLLLTLVKSIWMSEFHLVLLAWRSWVSTTATQLVVVVAIAMPIMRKYSITLLDIARKVGRVFLISCASCTCTVSIPENYDCCENRLGIDYRVFVFGIPIGTTVFKPATAVRIVFLCYFVMWSNHLAISLSWLVLLFIMAMVMSVATPAIPGGTLMLCGMLFAQLGMPDDVLAQMLTTDVFFDCVCIAFNQIAVSLGLAAYSSKNGLINEKILKG